MIEALIELAKALEPAALDGLVRLAKLAIGGATKEELATEAERLATLTAYKRAYRDA